MTIAEHVAQVIAIAWVAQTVFGAPFLSTSERLAARKLRRSAVRTFRRIARR